MEWALLASLPVDERERILGSARRIRFKRGEIVFRDGDLGDALYLIESGRFHVQVGTPAGDAATINILVPGDFFGELALVRDPPALRRTATVIAAEPAQALSLPGSQFARICETHPKAERFMTIMLAHRVDELSRRLVEALYLSVDQRVYVRLHELADIYRSDALSIAIAIPLTQDDLAGMAGASRPSVNQVLRRLAARHIVSLGRRHIEVIDYSALAALAHRSAEH